MSRGFRSEQDRRARIEEVRLADDAEALFQSDVLKGWKRDRVNDVLESLATAESENDRIMAQARLIELNGLAKSLRTTLETGDMARQQIQDDNRLREAKKARTET